MKTIKELKAKLENEIKKSSQVFIIGHNEPDFDSIGSGIGLYCLAKYYKKSAYIIIDDDLSKLDPGVKMIMDDTSKKVKYIRKDKFLELVNSNSLLIMTDVNKLDRISISDSIDKVRKIIAIDHHYDMEERIPEEDKFITFDFSSASEIITSVFDYSKIPYCGGVASYLFAGISQDTARFKRNLKENTLSVASSLKSSGADIDYVNDLSLEEFESFCRISNLIIHGTILKKYTDSKLAPIQVSFTINRSNPQEINAKEDYAKAADRLLKFRGFDAAFVLGYISPETVHISARSNKKVDVGRIMKTVHGGGNPESAGGKIDTANIFAIEQEIMNNIQIGISEEEKIIKEPPVVLVKQRGKKKK